MKFILACLMAGIVLPAAAQAQTCFYEPQKTTFYVGPQGQDRGQAPRNIGGYTYYGSQGLVQGQQRRCRQDSGR